MRRPSAAARDGVLASGQRIDQWLWCARFLKSRTLAAAFVAKGGVRLSRGEAAIRVDKPSYALRPGDSLTFVLNDRIRIVSVVATAARRGPAAEARTLYEDLSPPDEPEPNGDNPKGPRPTKKDRRALLKLKRPSP